MKADGDLLDFAPSLLTKGFEIAPRMLSRSERIVARLASTGLRNEEIATQLNRRVGTIKNQLRSAYRKLGVRNRVELARHLIACNTERVDSRTEEDVAPLPKLDKSRRVSN